MDYEERKLWEQLFKKVVIEHIREARISKGWTQAKLAEAVGVSHEFIRSMESVKGKNAFSTFTIWRISKALDVSLDVLLDFNMDVYRPFIKKAMLE